MSALRAVGLFFDKLNQRKGCVGGDGRRALGFGFGQDWELGVHI
jgi:hypothetical protein